MFIDIHAHLNFAIFKDDVSEVVSRAREKNVAIINVGTKLATSRTAVALAHEHEHMYTIVGLHPIHTSASFHDTDEIGHETKPFTSQGEVFDTDAFRELCADSHVVGIGECGLDYFRSDESARASQENAFRAQIELALECNLPVMLHVRPSTQSMDAYEDTLTILKEYKKTHGDTLRGNVHFFAGTTDIAQEFLDLGFDLSFTGVITFAREYADLVAYVPLDRMHAETDCPYVAPVPHRGDRNEPSYVTHVVHTIAEIKNMNEDDVATQLFANAQRLFRIPS